MKQRCASEKIHRGLSGSLLDYDIHLIILETVSQMMVKHKGEFVIEGDILKQIL